MTYHGCPDCQQVTISVGRWEWLVTCWLVVMSLQTASRSGSQCERRCKYGMDENFRLRTRRAKKQATAKLSSIIVSNRYATSSIYCAWSCDMVKEICASGLGLNPTWLVTSRHDTTLSTCRAHAFWLCRACRTARLYMLDTSNVSCRDVTWRDEPSGIWVYICLKITTTKQHQQQ